MVVPTIGLIFSSRSDADHTSEGTMGFNDDNSLQFDGPFKKEKNVKENIGSLPFLLFSKTVPILTQCQICIG